MSKYEWEEGTLVLPVAEYRRVRDALVKEHNTLQAANLLTALEIYSVVLAKLKEKRGQNHFELIHQTIQVYAKNGFDYELIEQSLIKKSGASDAYANLLYTLRKPKKSDFPLANGATRTFFAGYEGEITLLPKTHSIRWEVGENNHAVDNAWESPMGRCLERLLRGVAWTSRTGGHFVGNDEYNSDDREAGGGGNYVTKRYGNAVGKDKFSLNWS